MKRSNIKLPKLLVATLVSLSGLATVSAFGKVNRAVAHPHTGEDNSISQQMTSPQESPPTGENQMQNQPQESPPMGDNQMQNQPQESPPMGENQMQNQPQESPPTGENQMQNQPQESSPTGENQMQNQPENYSANETIVGALSDRESYDILVRAVEAAGLADTLQNTGEYTVFAPTNEAFEALPPGTLEALLQPENQDTLRRILEYHVVLGKADSSAISTGLFETVEGAAVDIDVARGIVEVEGATVTEPDIQASNGVIHGIDQVILPPDISAAELQQLTPAQ